MTAEQVFSALGGVGMFLLGMDVLSGALRDAAGPGLRRLLARFTTTPLRGVMTGALVTAVVQSSSATTVMTVGFVGAGLLNLGQALGILYGANIGTTMTGWLVSLFGLKLQLGDLAMAALLPASLALLLAHGATARIGRMVAGLALMLIGLELMQQALSGTVGLVLPEQMAGSGLLAMLELAVVGMVVTVLIQSSSAAVALTLVLLQAGIVDVMQAAAMVVGMNVGTTFTAFLASIGGSRQMRQTAVANLLFNLATGALALVLLFLVLSEGLEDLAASAGPLTALMVFHTGFNLAGTAIFLPLTTHFARLVRWLVPEGREALLINLDTALLDDPDAALLAAHAAAMTIRNRIFSALADALVAPADLRALSALSPRVTMALDELEDYVTAISLAGSGARQRAAFSALLHEIDHLRRLYSRSQQKARIANLANDAVLVRPAGLLSAILRAVAARQGGKDEAARLARLEPLLEHRARRHRQVLMQGEHSGRYSVQDVFRHTDAMRWLQRSLHHVSRIMRYDREVAQALAEA